MFNNFDQPCSAYAMAERERHRKEEEQRQSALRIHEQQLANETIVRQLVTQNGTLREQVDLLKEENERQKQQLLQSQKNEELARKEAKSSKIFSYISFGVATVLSIIALVVAIIK